jgi:glycosyltransferase 2 family protein
MESFRKHLPSLLRWLGTLLAIGLLIWLLSSQGWEKILSAFQQINAWRLALALGLMLLSRLAVAGRWYALLRGADEKISFGLATRITFAGLFASNFLPTTIGGDVVRLGGALRFGIDRAVGLTSLIVDRIVGMAGMAMALLGLVFFVQPAPVSLLATMPLPPKSFFRRGLRRLRDVSALWMRRPDTLLAALGLTWVHMLCTFAIADLVLVGMGQKVSFPLIGGMWSLVYFITLLPVSVNGMGTQELAISLLFTRLGGISTESALVLALLMRVLPMLASLPGALFVPGMLAGEPEPQKEEGLIHHRDTEAGTDRPNTEKT